MVPVKTAPVSTSSSLLAIAIVGALAAACRGPAPASESRPGVPMRFGDDLVASGPEVSIAEGVPGDAILAGSEIRFDGAAGGDLLAAGGRQRLAGAVRGSVRAAGGDIALNAPVGRNATLAGGRIALGPATRVEGNVYAAGGQVTVGGEVGGYLVATGGDVVIDGVVEGDALVRASSLRLGPSARIAGDLHASTPGARVTIDPGARVDGGVIAQAAPPLGRTLRFLGWILAFGFLVAGAVAVALAPGRADASAVLVRRRPLAAAGVGIAVLILAPIAVTIVAITVVGIPLAAIAAALYAIAVYLARAVFAVWLGRLLLGGRAPAGRKGALAAFLVGGVLLFLVRFVPVLGGIVGAVATVVGLGALALTLVRLGHAASPAAG